MSSSKEYFYYISEQLSLVDGISFRPMMGEYVVYLRDKVAGGIFDDRLMIKPVASALDFVENPVLELPYEKGSKMLLVEETDDREFLRELFERIYDELPMPKSKKKRQEKKMK